MRGRAFPAAGGRRFSEPLIQLPNPDEPLLSFTNLAEAHVLAAIRRRHGVPMQKVRPALEFLDKELEVGHPLAHKDGVSLFIEHLGRLVNLSQRGQLAVEHDASCLAVRRDYEISEELIEEAIRYELAA